MQPFKTEYRYPLMTSLVMFLVTAAISIGAAYFMYRARVEGATREVFLAGWFTFWFGVFALLARRDLRARLQPANWLVRTQTNGILVKFRSYGNVNKTCVGIERQRRPVGRTVRARREVDRTAACEGYVLISDVWIRLMP